MREYFDKRLHRGRVEEDGTIDYAERDEAMRKKLELYEVVDHAPTLTLVQPQPRGVACIPHLRGVEWWHLVGHGC